MPEFFSSAGPYSLQFLVIFLVILFLLMGIVFVFRRLAGRGLSMAARTNNRSRQPRLGIVDIYELDRQRQLILLRRDNVEHLLLVGGPNDVVVERNVIRSAGSRLPADTVLRPDSAPGLSADGGEPEQLNAPSFTMPLVVPPPKSGGNGHDSGIGRAPPLDPTLFEPEASPDDRPAGEPVKSRIGISQVGRILRRLPPLGEARHDAAPEPELRMPAPPPAAEASEPRPIVPPSLLSSGPPRPIDPTALSDMARQLETALRRQSSAVTPPPGQPEPVPRAELAAPEPTPAPAPPAPAPAPAPSPEPVIAQATARPNPTFMLGRANAIPQAQPPAQAPDAHPDSVAVAVAPPQPTEPAAKPPSEAKSAQQPAAFTVEEIETEFARLLGRPLDRKT